MFGHCSTIAFEDYLNLHRFVAKDAAGKFAVAVTKVI